MVDWKKLADSASGFVNKRGGTKSVMEDASELAEIAKREGSLSEKAKAAGEALKEPGAHHDASAGQPETQAQPDTQAQAQASQGVADDQSR